MLTEAEHAISIGVAGRGNDVRLLQIQRLDKTLKGWRRLAGVWPDLSYGVAANAVKWSLLRVAQARKASTMSQLFERGRRVAHHVYRLPAGDAVKDALHKLARGVMLYNKAPYARGEDDFRGLRALALRLAPELFAAWELLGADTPNFKVRKRLDVYTVHAGREGGAQNWLNMFTVSFFLLPNAHMFNGLLMDHAHSWFKRGAQTLYPGRLRAGKRWTFSRAQRCGASTTRGRCARCCCPRCSSTTCRSTTCAAASP